MYVKSAYMLNIGRMREYYCSWNIRNNTHKELPHTGKDAPSYPQALCIILYIGSENYIYIYIPVYIDIYLYIHIGRYFIFV